MHPLLEIKQGNKAVFTRWARFDPNQLFTMCRNMSVHKEVRRNKYLFEVFGNRLAAYIDSSRFQTLARSQKCYACGLKGTHLFLETNHSVEAEGSTFGYGAAAFNFYAVVGGKLVLMTEDHMVPQSLRGPERDLFRSQFERVNNIVCEDTGTMCTFCNHAKSDVCFSFAEIRERSLRNKETFLSSPNSREWLNQTSDNAPITDFWTVFRAKCPLIPKSVKKWIKKMEKESISA